MGHVAYLVCLVLVVNGAWSNLDIREASPTRNDTVVVTIRPGQQLRGFYRALVTGKVIYKFWGVRYGQSTSGNGRFAAPKAAQDWTGIRDAFQFGPKCWQDPSGKSQSEDCLFLNVFSPNVNGSAPVMVWIHGGAYNSGAGSDFRYDGSTLAAKGVVVVTINYRLGAYGFLSTDDDVMPGNYGLLDQVLALKWVQKHIRAFGGDPGQVTIFGESAGSSSVSLHIVSPLSNGLFHRAIMQSGCSLSVWAIERPATDVSVEEYTRQLGLDVGCVDKDSATFLACLRKIDAHVLFNASLNLRNRLNIDIIANPRVETKFGFLPHYPQYLLDHGLFNKVDTLRGFNSGEWAFVIDDPDEDGLTREEFRSNFENVFEVYLVNNVSRQYLIDLVERIYLGNETDLLAIRTSLIDAFTDTLFAASELLELETYIRHGGQNNSHYVYELDYKVQSLLNLQSLLSDWLGVIHSGDLPLVFTDDQVGLVASLTTPDDAAVGDKIQTLWTNFAKTGNPVATQVLEDGVPVLWDQYTLTNPKLLRINKKSTLTPYRKHDLLPVYSEVLDFLKGTNNTTL